MYAFGRGVVKDKSRSAALYQKACKLGGAHACLKIGEYRTGQLLKMEYASTTFDNDKARYELTIHDGPDQYVAVYRMDYFQHDRSIPRILWPVKTLSTELTGRTCL
jgi:TPR repeat protein